MGKSIINFKAPNPEPPKAEPPIDPEAEFVDAILRLCTIQIVIHSGQVTARVDTKLAADFLRHREAQAPAEDPSQEKLPL